MVSLPLILCPFIPLSFFVCLSVTLSLNLSVFSISLTRIREFLPFCSRNKDRDRYFFCPPEKRDEKGGENHFHEKFGSYREAAGKSWCFGIGFKFFRELNVPGLLLFFNLFYILPLSLNFDLSELNSLIIPNMSLLDHVI